MIPTRKQPLRRCTVLGLVAAALLHAGTASPAATGDQDDNLEAQLDHCRRLTDRVKAVVTSIERRLASGPVPIDWDQLVRAAAARPEPTPKKEGIRLDGVAWDSQNPLAFVNNKLVRVNDDVAGFTVIAITENSITVRNAKGQTKQLQLYEVTGETDGKGES